MAHAPYRITTVSAVYINDGKPTTRAYTNHRHFQNDWERIDSERAMYLFAVATVSGLVFDHFVSATLPRSA